MKSKTKLDLDRLKYELHNMTFQSSLYKILKSELTLLGYWKNKKRGKPNPKFVRH